MRENVLPDVPVSSFDALITLSAIIALGPDSAPKQKLDFLLHSRGMTSEKVQECLELLVKEAAIQKDKAGYKSLRSRGYNHWTVPADEQIAFHKDFLESAKRFFDNFSRPATGSSALVVIHKDRYDEVRERILTLKHWLLEVSDHDAKSPHEETIQFQSELHLLPVFHPQILQEVRALTAKEKKK